MTRFHTSRILWMAVLAAAAALPGMRARASELGPSFRVPATRRSGTMGSFSGRVLVGQRYVVSGWPVRGAEFLEPDDLDQAEPVGVRA